MFGNNDGTYKHCSKCQMEKNCCCEFDKIDNIITTVSEKNEIVKRLGASAEMLFKLINDGAYNIINNQSVCPFYNQGCTIYDIRPSDCRLFPYDIKNIDGKHFLIKYDMPCGSKNVDENIDGVVEVLKTIIKTYTDKKRNEKVDRLSYIIIKEII